MEFENLRFKLEEDKLVVSLYEIFKFDIPLDELKKIGNYEIKEHEIICDNENKFNFLISKHIINLKNKISNKPAVYVHANSGIPLIGSNYFGIVDRGTNIIEIKPLTSCNLNCIFCSVDEGIDSKKQTDFIIEKDYLIQELNRVIKEKECDKLEILINPQGEPMLYSRIVELIQDIKSQKVKSIAMNTNGTLLNEKKIDALINAGITRINFSVNAIDKEKANDIAGTTYNIEQVKKIVEYTAKKIDINIAPVWVQGINNDDIDKLIEWVKNIKTDKIIFLGIQNMVEHRFGRKAAKQLDWDEFNEKIKKLEEKYDINLHDSEGFEFIKTNELKKPFKKNDVIEAVTATKGRLKREMIATAQNRVISIINCDPIIGKKVKIKIIRSKNNIFTAALL